ncbi:MAG TPA: acido-empty-quinoprotein group A [Bryobacteraceae bacterium]|jgi:alcohol dehydrogenase (cytochrome c)
MIRFFLLACFAAILPAQTLNPHTLALFNQPPDIWPTYNGDYSGRRFSSLKQINQSNLAHLDVAWKFQITGIPPLRGIGKAVVKSTPLMVNGVLYFTVPNHVFALDARTGRRIWQFDWEDHGGHLLGQRGVGMYGSWLYFLTPDGWFISLNAKDGSERWRKKVADEKLQYFTTMSPLVVKNHVLVGVGGDAMDVRGYLESRDPETGDLQWRWWSEPEKPGDPGSETWPNKAAMDHGGGMTWMPGTYDPDINLIYWGTGNANPVFAGQSRKGANLWTASIVALNPDTGKLAWWFQASPHDTHDWDNVETPVLFDAVIDGKSRKLLAQGARCGWLFVLDRTNGKNLVSKPFSGTGNWAKGVDAKGQPIPDPAKEPTVDGSMIDMPTMGATNWQPPSYSPDTELFYLNGTEGYGLAYLYDTSDQPEGYGGGTGGTFDQRSALFALDIRTGETRWKHEIPQGQGSISGGILTTAGKLLFTGDSSSVTAFNPADGKILWHQRLASPVSNGPSTWMLDGKQYLIVGAGDSLYAFTLQGEK